MSSQDRLVKEHFGSIASFYGDRYYDDSPMAHLFTTRLERVNELLGESKGMSVLDLGCGPGLTASHLTRRDCRYFGLDLSEEMLIACQSTFGPSLVHLAVGNMKNLPFTTSSFDTVLCLGAIEYVEDANIAIREISRVVEENGTVIIAMQNKLSPYLLWENYIYRGRLFNLIRKARGHTTQDEPGLKIFSMQRFRDLLFRHQLQAIDVVYYDFNVWLAPLDRCFPKFSVFMSRRLESLYQSSLKGLGTGFIIKAKKVTSRPSCQTA